MVIDKRDVVLIDIYNSCKTLGYCRETLADEMFEMFKLSLSNDKK